ncbi:MAG: PqqD family protein [Patescibacteria group bacterium]|jgi:hypothetical protein
MVNYCRVENIFQKVVDDSLCLLKNKDKFVYKLNETAAFLWQLLEKKSSRKKLIEALSANYQIPYSQAEKDVDNFLKYYLGEKLIKKVSE